MQTSRLNAGLLGSSGGNHFTGVDERQALGIIAALKIDRFVFGAVDMNHLARVQADPNTRRRVAVGIGVVPHHDVDGAVPIARLKMVWAEAWKEITMSSLTRIGLLGLKIYYFPRS